MPDQETLTAEEIQAHYDAALDSVTVITDLMAQDSRTDDETATVARNVEHLQIMVAKDYWTSDHSMAPLNAAITAGS